MKTIDLSKKDDFYSQMNNRFYPLEACTPTSHVNALFAEGVDVVLAGSRTIEAPAFVYPKGIAPDDYLMALCRSPIGFDFKKTVTPWFADNATLNPNEIHAVVAAIVNAVIGRDVARRVDTGTITDIVAEISNGHPVVCSGNFTSYGHTVCVVGVVFDDGGNVIELIVDDPYGDWHTGYKSHQGNGIHFTVAEWLNLWKGGMTKFNKAGV